MTTQQTRRSAREAGGGRYRDVINRYLGGAESAAARHREHTPPTRVPERHTVVVGVDGSDLAVAAVDQAAVEAALRGWGLRIVHAQPRTAAGGLAGLLLGSVSQALIHGAACPVFVVH